MIKIETVMIYPLLDIICTKPFEPTLTDEV